MSKNTTGEKRLLSFDAFYIPVGTALIYGASFFFEKGFLSSFNIPDIIIRISIEQFFYFLISSFGIYIIAMHMIDTNFSSVSPDKPINLQEMVIIGLSNILFAVSGFIFAFDLVVRHKFEWVELLIALFSGFFIVLIHNIPNLRLDDTGGRVERINKFLMTIIAKKFINTHYMVVLIILIIPTTLYLLGAWVGFNQTSYPSYSTELDKALR